MDEIKLNQVIAYAKLCHPKDALSISDGLDIFNLALEDFRESINISLAQFLKEKNYVKVREVTNVSEMVSEIQAIIDGYSVSIDVLLDNDEEIEEENIVEEEKVIPNYAEYAVDNLIPRSLYENFTHKKAKAFSFAGKRYEARDWKDVLIQTCNLLADIDSEKFRSLVNDPDMKGRKVSYFGYELIETNTGIKNCQMKNLDIYVWTNLSANQIRNLIRKLLTKYGIKISGFYIYLRADYSPLHENKSMHKQI